MAGKQYKLRILPLFEEDFNEILDYITLRLKNTMHPRMRCACLTLTLTLASYTRC